MAIFCIITLLRDLLIASFFIQFCYKQFRYQQINFKIVRSFPKYHRSRGAKRSLSTPKWSTPALLLGFDFRGRRECLHDPTNTLKRNKQISIVQINQMISSHTLADVSSLQIVPHVPELGDKYILSIDIGLRNMCFTILKQRNQLQCNKYKQTNENKTKEMIQVNADAFDIIRVLVRDINNKDQFVVISNLKKMLDDICQLQKNKDLLVDQSEPLENCSSLFDIKYIIVEKQIGKFGFKQLEYAIFMYIQLIFPDIQMFSIHPSHKLKVEFKQDHIEEHELQTTKKIGKSALEGVKLKSKYGQNKKDAILQLYIYNQIKGNIDISNILQQNIKNHPDIADCLLQTYYVFSNLNPI